MSPDPFEELRRDPALSDLVRRVEAEQRAEAEENERLAALDRLRTRCIGDVAVEACHRGDVVEVTFPARRITGVVVHAAGDLATVRTAAGDVDVRLGAACAWRIVEAARSGGSAPSGGARRFAGRLAEHEAAGGVVTVGASALDLELVGRIVVAARDHVVVRTADGQEWHVPHCCLDWVAPAPAP